MNFRYKEQLAREQRALAERLAALTPRWRTKPRASDSCSSGSDWSSASSLSSSGSSEWPDSGGCGGKRGRARPSAAAECREWETEVIADVGKRVRLEIGLGTLWKSETMVREIYVESCLLFMLLQEI